MIIALSGALCSGKAALAEYLSREFGFVVVNLIEVFAKDIDTPVTEEVIVRFFSVESKDVVQRLFDRELTNAKADWQKNFVIYPFLPIPEMANYIDKYQVLLYEVEAPMLQRFARYQKKRSAEKGASSLEDFIKVDDALNFSRAGDRALKVVHTFVNKEDSLDSFYSNLLKFNFTNSELLRPKWDTYFLRLAEVVATRSNCMKRAVGAVIVNDLRIVSTGYNGTPFGCSNCNEGGCERCNSMAASGQRLDECLCIHAEENAVIEAGRAKANGGTIYVTLSPCLTCSKSVIQAGIKRIVYNRKYNMPAAEEFWRRLDGKVEIVQMDI